MFLYLANQFNPRPDMTLSRKPAPDVRHIETLGAPLYLLPRTVADYEASKSSKYWYNIRRAQKQFESEFGQLDFQWIQTETDLDFWLPKVHSLFLARWSKRYISSPWKTVEGFTEYSLALHKLCREGKASLAVLSRSGELLSFSYNLHQDNVFYFYQHATSEEARYRKFSLGKIFLTQLLREVIASNRFNAFDFMIGEAGYKYEWADRTQRVYVEIRRREKESVLSFLSRVWISSISIRLKNNETLKNLVLTTIQRISWLRKIMSPKPLPATQLTTRML